MSNYRKAAPQVSLGGFSDVSMLADEQVGPTCGFEAVENIIQLFHDVDNDLSWRELIPIARRFGKVEYAPGGPVLAMDGYRLLLSAYEIPTRWYSFQHRGVVVSALENNRGVLVVGDAHQLDPASYPDPASWHAFVVTNYLTDESGSIILGYVGLDSNFADEVQYWPAKCVERAALIASRSLQRLPVLVTDVPARWPDTVRSYRLLRNGRVLPVW